MTINYKELKSLYISDPSQAIAESQRIICSVTDFNSFRDFYNYHLEHSNVSTCQNHWSNYQMSVHCVDCALDPQSCFCLQCFLDSNHQGHDYLVRPDSIGNCDCGDLSLWKRSGFCSKHHGIEDDSHPEDYLDEKLRKTLTDIVFKAAFSSLKHLTNDNGQKISPILQFLTSFLKFGDGFRRLLSMTLTEKINFEKLLNLIFDATVQFNHLLQQFCGLLLNDQLFKNNFSRVNYKIMIEKLIPISISEFTSQNINKSLAEWDSFWFHSYQLPQFKYNIEKCNWDWVKFGVDFLNFAKEMLILIGNPKYDGKIPKLLISTIEIEDASKIQPNEQTQNLFDILFTQVLQTGTTKGIKESINDTIIYTSFKDKTQESHYAPLYYFNFIFFKIINCFDSKKTLKFDKMFEGLDKTIDISPIFMIGKNIVEYGKDIENDKFISKYIKTPNLDHKINDSNYKSFHNGGTFYICYPMYYSFLYLLRNDNISRIKIARTLSATKYQSLRIQLGIITIKNLLSLVCFHQSLVRKSNFGATQLLSSLINNPRLVDGGIPLLIPSIQLLIGLQNETNKNDIFEFSLKEFFAFEMAREIGLFDDFNGIDYKDEDTNEDQKQMIFSFLYISLLIVIERNLFNFNGYEFMKEQIIFAFKRGVSNLNDLRELFDIRVSKNKHYLADMNKIVAEVATARQKKTTKESSSSSTQTNDVSFVLKDGIEFKNISAINSFNIEKVLMNDQISKNSEKLLKIQNFMPEENYFFATDEDGIDSNGLSIQLKEFLLTPTVLAVIYHTLRSGSEKVELNDHLALNILLLISKFVKEDEEVKNSETLFDSEKTVIYYDSTVSDLIYQLRKTVFDLRTDDDGSITVKNRLTRHVFNSLLKVKITPENQQPKSFIEILIEKGEIGKNLLSQMSIEIEGIHSEKQDIKALKKLRAQKLKSDIINHYRTMTNNFNANDDQNDDTISPSNNQENDLCPICSRTKEDELLFYPVYIYRTKFPFIIDKPPLVNMPIKEAIRETEVFEDEILLEDMENLTNEDTENESNLDESNLIDPEIVFSRILANNPNLNLSDDLTDEQIIYRQQLIHMIKQRIYNKYEADKAIIIERKKNIERKKKLKEEILKKEEMKKKIESENPNSFLSKQISPGNNFVIQFGICQHLVHPSCINKNWFECPVDRTMKNGFLPNIDDLSKDEIFINGTKELTPKLQKSISIFVSNYNLLYHASKDKIVDVFVELIKSISGLISTYEIRLRNLPDCLDSKKTKILPRNLFLTTWYGYRSNDKPKMKTGFNDIVIEDIDSRLTVFQRFIKKLIESDEIEESYDKKNQLLNDFVSSLVNELKSEKEICLFLRRVCLADHFLLTKNDQHNETNKFIDWDEILSTQNLSKRFNIEFKNMEEFEFKPFIFSILPKEFLRLAKPPYNLPVDQTHKIAMFNILDYNFLIKNYDDFADLDQSKINENYINQDFRCDGNVANSFFISNFSANNFPTILLSIGLSSSQIYVIDRKLIALLKPFYLDRYGCDDIGFRRNQPLFLNEDRFERLMDEFLSGDYSNSLKYMSSF